MRNQTFWGLFALSIALVIMGFIAAGAVVDIKTQRETISVTGSARKPIMSDYVVWRGAISARRPTMEDAYREVNRGINRLKSFLQENNIPDSLIDFSTLSTHTIYNYDPKRGQTNEITGYELRQNFTVSSEDVNEITRLSRQVSELIQEGIPVESYPLEYLVTKLNKYRIDMLGEATADAKLRADKIAESVDAEVGDITEAQMGVFQVTKRHSTDVAGYGLYDTSTPDKDIMAVVKVTFEIE